MVISGTTSPDNSAQKTLKSAIHCSGVGLHSGREVLMTLKPSDVNTGITFIRTDVAEGRRAIPATWDRVTDTQLCTVVGNDEGVSVGTVEHLMAALRGCGVDNAVIELNGPEVPIMDGSAAPFVFLIECAGLVSQAASRTVIRILKPVEVQDGSKLASFVPANDFSFSMEIEFASRAVSRQQGYVRLANGAFKSEVARARTFGFLNDVEHLRSLGLALGGSLDNAIVINDDRVMNEEGLRYKDEFVRHKILDSVGDLYLAGAPILGHFHGVKSGHALNNRLLHALFADESAWCYDTMDAIDVNRGTWQPEALARTA
ncbi:MAG TPA: UDP-3-O-acyl-N-acetylglucosamine deacetylase [Alphaproteobacteria bacterium]|nr:UDP-3-O-acyl-N-acetylglucosamine deacetylase [Alphaproteobacteria bacterium]